MTSSSNTQRRPRSGDEVVVYSLYYSPDHPSAEGTTICTLPGNFEVVGSWLSFIDVDGEQHMLNDRYVLQVSSESTKWQGAEHAGFVGLLDEDLPNRLETHPRSYNEGEGRAKPNSFHADFHGLPSTPCPETAKIGH